MAQMRNDFGKTYRVVKHAKSGVKTAPLHLGDKILDIEIERASRLAKRWLIL